jgi:hypothetical protein
MNPSGKEPVMKQKVFGILSLLGIFIVAISLSASDKYKVVDDFYFGHISFTETGPDGDGPVILREGMTAPEPAVLNAPLGPGDTVRTTDIRRCEVQFDTGTIVRLDISTELKIETIFARSLSRMNGISNLALTKGRVYIMYKEYDSRELFQVLTANAAVKMKHNTVAMIKALEDGSTDIQVRYGKVSAMFGPDAGSAREKDVKKLQRLVVLKDHQFETADYVEGTEFEKWNDEINASFADLHEGKNALPKPIQKLPKAVFYFAQNYGNMYGEWLWDGLYGYVWRPFYNDRYPWGNWQPYFYGHWAAYQNQMFWVPDEPWGWVPYHLGIWQWDKKLGWVWLPGSLFAPAWVDWEFFNGCYCWRPWSLWDWYYMDSFWGPWGAYGFYTQGDSWTYNWPPKYSRPSEPVLTKIRKDQLKKGGSNSLPMPKEIKATFKNVIAGLGRKDPRALESLNRVPAHLVFIDKAGLNARRIQDKALTWDKVMKPAASTPASLDAAARVMMKEPSREAMRVFKSYELAESGFRRPDAGSARAPDPMLRRMDGRSFDRSLDALRSLSFGPAERFRDWNPDVRIARSLGVRIDYSSATNEVRCPQLKISSRDTERFGVRLSSDGISYSHPGSFSDGSGVPSGSSYSSGASRGEHAGPASSEGGKSGGTVKKD